MTPLTRQLAQHQSYPLFAICKRWVVGLVLGKLEMQGKTEENTDA
jgi:hypothetical protein